MDFRYLRGKKQRSFLLGLDLYMGNLQQFLLITSFKVSVTTNKLRVQRISYDKKINKAVAEKKIVNTLTLTILLRNHICSKLQ